MDWQNDFLAMFLPVHTYVTFLWLYTLVPSIKIYFNLLFRDRLLILSSIWQIRSQWSALQWCYILCSMKYVWLWNCVLKINCSRLIIHVRYCYGGIDTKRILSLSSARWTSAFFFISCLWLQEMVFYAPPLLSLCLL